MRVRALWRRKRILLVSLGAVLAACEPAPSLDSGAPPPASVVEGWESRWAREGDVPTDVASEAPGTPGWTPIVLGMPPEGREGDRLAWFHVRLPGGEWPHPALFIEHVDTDFEVYLEGRLLSTYGQLWPPFSRDCPGMPWHLVQLPPDAAGKVLALRVHSRDPMDLGPYGRVSLGARSDLLKDVATSQLDVVLIGLLCVCLGSVALIPGVRSREQRPLLWFGVSALAWGVVLVAACDVRLLFWNAPGAWYRLHWLGFTLGPAALCALAESLFGNGRRWFAWLSRAALGLGLLLHAALLVDFWTFDPVGIAYDAVAKPALLLATGWVAVHEAWRGQRTARVFLLGLLGYAVGDVHDLLMAAHVLEPGPTRWAYGLLFLLAVLGALAHGHWRGMFRVLSVHAHALEEKNARLEEAEHALQAAVRARDDFLSVASHELKTPLTALLLRVQRLERTVRQQEASGREPLLGELEAVRRQAAKLDRLAEDLLDVTRMASGPPSLKPSPLDLAALVRETVARSREEAERVGCAVSCSGPEALVGLWDGLRLEQVVTNLLSNALKYGAGKPVTVVLERRGEAALLTVKDEGVGIAPEAQGRIFNRFERAASARNYPGLGLGLWIVREIVCAMGGTIRVESAPERGSRFEVELPVPPVPVDVLAKAG